MLFNHQLLYRLIGLSTLYPSFNLFKYGSKVKLKYLIVAGINWFKPVSCMNRNVEDTCHMKTQMWTLSIDKQMNNNEQNVNNMNKK